MSKKRPPFWAQSTFRIQNAQSTPFSAEQAHPAVARSTFLSQKQKTEAEAHFWTFRCRFLGQAQGIVHLVKSEQNVKVLWYFKFQPPLHYTTLHYTLQLQLQLRYTYTNCSTLHYATPNYITLDYTTLTTATTTTTLHFTSLHFTSLHSITLRYTTTTATTTATTIITLYTTTNNINIVKTTTTSTTKTTLHHTKHIALHDATLHYTTLH